MLEVVPATTNGAPAAGAPAAPRVEQKHSIMTTAAGTNQGAFEAVDWMLFFSIGGIWGSSFLLMAIGLDALEPGVITWLRVTAGAVTLACVPRARAPIARADWPRLLALSVLWVALPFSLFPVAQQHINSAT